MNHRLLLLLLLVVLPVAAPVAAQEPDLHQFDVLLALLPEGERGRAQLSAPAEGDDHHTLTILRAGDGAFACIGDLPADQQFSIRCFHRSLTPFVLLERRLRREGFSGQEYKDKRCEAVDSGSVLMPDQALMLSASAARPAHGGLPRQVSIYRLLQMPSATHASTGLPENPPTPGAPYLHHGGTCDAHLMWSTTEDMTVLPAQ